MWSPSFKWYEVALGIALFALIGWAVIEGVIWLFSHIRIQF